MSARHDYPAIAVHSRFGNGEGQECVNALAEIDRLRAQLAHYEGQLAHYEGWFGTECRCDDMDTCPL